MEIRFLEYFRAGAVITLLSIAAGILILTAEVRIAQGSEAVAAVNGQQITVKAMPRGIPGAGRNFSVVLLCDTDAKRVQGLQGFRRLKRGEAALFVFDPPQEVTFWMGTVPYPLDIIFVRADGSVAEVAPHCRPGSSRFYGSGVPVKWVVETAADSGIVAGDRVRIE